MDLFYDRVLGVRFWDYAQLRYNIRGRVCLTFSLCWTGLALVLVYLLAPLADRILSAIPAVLGPPAMILLVCCGGRGPPRCCAGIVEAGEGQGRGSSWTSTTRSAPPQLHR